MEWSWEDFDIRSICKDILLNIWAVLLAAAAAYYGITGVYSLRYVPEYTSSATLAVTMRGNNGGSYSSLNMTKEMAGIISEVFQSEALRGKIAEDLGVDSIEGEISIELIQETNLMNLSVVSDTPQNAYRILLSALDNYETVSDYLFSNAKLDMLKEPSIPYGPSNPQNISRVRKMGTLIAAGSVVLLIALVSFLRPTVKNEKNAKRQLDGRILGTIPFVRKYRTKKEWLRQLLHLKLKRSVLISSVMLGAPFIESTKKIATSIEHHMRRHHQKVFLVSSVEENEGKSSVTANLALALAGKGYRVLLVDCDLKMPALYKIFDRKKLSGPSVSKFLDGTRPFSDILVQEQPGLYAAYQYYAVADASVLLSGEGMPRLLEEGKKQFDYILVDTPPMSVSADAEILLHYADSAAIVVRQDWVDIGSINDAAEVVRGSSCNLAGFILNAFHAPFPWQGMESDYGYGYGGIYGRKEQ